MKRERLLKSNWKHGVLGIESPESPVSDPFVNRQNDRADLYQEKGKLYNARKKDLFTKTGTTTQIGFGINKQY